MRVRVGCEFDHQAEDPTPTVWQVRPRADGPHRLVEESWGLSPPVPWSSYVDSYGNTCDRLTLPAGETTLRYDAVLELGGGHDETAEDAAEVPVEALPDDTLVFLLPSRFCWSDALLDQAWELFGDVQPGWPRVQAICDWVHENLTYDAEASTPLTTAWDVWESRRGVCRDYAHLGLTLCRSLNVPARYVAGYIPPIAAPPTDDPMDFCSWFEAYLENRWWTFDPRTNTPRIGRVVIGRGRDALDVAMVTSYGSPVLRRMVVWAEEVVDVG